MKIFSLFLFSKRAENVFLSPCLSSSSFPFFLASIGTLSKDDDDGSENFAKKMNLRSFKLNRVYLDTLNMSNVGDLSWS